MDYFFWLIRGAGATVLVDTGFAAEVGHPPRPDLPGSTR